MSEEIGEFLFRMWQLGLIVGMGLFGLVFTVAGGIIVVMLLIVIFGLAFLSARIVDRVEIAYTEENL